MGNDGILSIELTGKVMMISVILLLLILLLVIALHFYVRWFWSRVELESGSSSATADAETTPRSLHGSAACSVEPGLDPKVLRSLPVVVFSGDEFKDGLECAVCLCEVVDGEMARVLPRCHHGFHVECIDMWLRSHVSCPLCRKSVVEEELLKKDVFVDIDGLGGDSADEDGGRGQNMDPSPNFPTNVLFWGNETQVSSGNKNACLEEGNSSSPSSSSGTSSSSVSRYIGLVIDVPAQAGENSGLGSGSGSEETKSPVQARLRSLRRLLSRDRRVAPSFWGSESQRFVDFENEMVSRGQPC